MAKHLLGKVSPQAFVTHLPRFIHSPSSKCLRLFLFVRKVLGKVMLYYSKHHEKEPCSKDDEVCTLGSMDCNCCLWHCNLQRSETNAGSKEFELAQSNGSVESGTGRFFIYWYYAALTVFPSYSFQQKYGRRILPQRQRYFRWWRNRSLGSVICTQQVPVSVHLHNLYCYVSIRSQCNLLTVPIFNFS